MADHKNSEWTSYWAHQLTPRMQEVLLAAREHGSVEFNANAPTPNALLRRGLVEIQRETAWSTWECVLTDKGREVVAGRA